MASNSLTKRAFMDESGNEGLDLSKPQVSSHYIVTAVILDESSHEDTFDAGAVVAVFATTFDATAAAVFPVLFRTKRSGDAESRGRKMWVLPRRVGQRRPSLSGRRWLKR